METLSMYKKAHLIVAAVRVLSHRKNRAPSVEDVCQCLNASSEHVHMICRRLEASGILEAVTGVEGARWFVRDHTAIEELSDDTPKSGIEEELAQFKKEQQARDQKIEAMKKSEADRKKKLFEELEAGLKQQVKK
ncbi:MAG: hypothetical protein SWH61_04180 [Thermodesulfobacteriota bacterium]|nr:hypothetical protein [Thermodesulfobacteriota bacterium]